MNGLKISAIQITTYGLKHMFWKTFPGITENVITLSHWKTMCLPALAQEQNCFQNFSWQLGELWLTVYQELMFIYSLYLIAST